MILAIILYYLMKTFIILVLSLYLIITVSLIYIKILEPVKGVCRSNARLDGKIVIVTGGNTGIGLEIARDLASRGAKVIIASRDGKKSAKAIADIIATTGNEDIEYRHLDLASFSSVRKFAKEFNNSQERLDILINNAGCGGLKHKATEDGIDIVTQINYLGHFLLTNLLLDKIKLSEAGRIVLTSSCAHHFASVSSNNLNGMHTRIQVLKYSNSKLSIVLWMKALAKRLPRNVTVNTVHPGVVKTDIFNKMYAPFKVYFLMLLDVLNFKTPKEGAQTSIHLAVSEEVAHISGKYFVDCAEAKYAGVADNEEFVEEIWKQSVKLTQL